MTRSSTRCATACPSCVSPGSSPGQALGLALEDKVPDAKACPEPRIKYGAGFDSGTVWLYRERLSQAGLIDASIIAVPIQRNRRDENEQIKRGETPEAWADESAKRRQKDTDARWTKKLSAAVLKVS